MAIKDRLNLFKRAFPMTRKPAMPPPGSSDPPANSPTPNESVVHGWGTTQSMIGQVQDNEPGSNYGISRGGAPISHTTDPSTGRRVGDNTGTGPGPSSGTDISTLEQNTAFREGIEPISNPPGISVVSTTDWFGPLQPLRPAAPMGTEPRKFEYVLGQNIIFEPRANEAISYSTLRAMADSMDLMRIIMETVKNEMKRSAWEITAPKKLGETGGERKEREMADPVVTEIKRLLEAPDGLHPWETFVGEVMEDMLAIDAPSILIRRTPDGKKVKNLIPIDGSKITRYISTSGLTPVYDPRCAHPAHGLLGRQQSGKTISCCPCAAYTQYLYGVNAVNLTTRDLVYMPYNMRPNKLYGYAPVEQVIVAINLYLRREMALLGYYTEGNIPEMIGFLPNTVTTEQVKEFEEWFNSVNRGDTAFMRRVRFVPNPSPSGDPKFVELKQQLLNEGLDEWLIRLICYAFNVPPTQLVKMHARAASDTMKEEAQMTGLEAYQKWFASVMNHIIKVQMGYVGYTFTFLPVRDPDILKQAQSDQLKVKSGRMTLNEWRESEGATPYDPAKFPDADKPLIFTPQGYVIVGDGPQIVQANAPQNGNGKLLPKPNTRANPNNQGDSGHKDGESPPFGKSDFPTQAVRGPAPHAAMSRMRDTILEVFGLQRKSFEQALGTLGKAKENSPTSAEKLWLAIAGYYSLLPDKISPILKQEAIDAAQQAAIEAGSTPAAAVASFETAQQYAHNRAAEMVGMRRTETGALEENPDARWVISDTTRDEIRRAVERALAGELKDEAGNPLPLPQAIRRLTVDQPNGPFSDNRAELIARTEIRNANVAGRMSAWKHMGVKETTWHTMGDERVCPMCAMNSGATRPLGKPFPSGYISPADSHPRCRCWLEPASLGKALMKSTLEIPRSWKAFFLRHGETEANEKNEARGWGKWPLTSEGRAQAKQAAEFLVGHGITKIISSDLLRGRETTSIVAGILKVPVKYSREVRSLNVGEFTGTDKLKTRDAFMPYLKNPKEKIPGGETLAGFIKRAVKFVVKTLAAEPEETILFITHSSDIGALWYAFNRASLLHLADNEVVMPGGVAALRNGKIIAMFRPAPPGKGELE